jgi:hypothetical protein
MSGAEPQAAGLAAVAAVARSAQGAEDSATLGACVCTSIARSLGFDCVALMRYSAKDDRVELVAEFGVPAQDWPGWIGRAGSLLLRRACDGGSPVLVKRTQPPTTGSVTLGAAAAGAAVLVPLFAGTSCLGFLAAVSAGAPSRSTPRGGRSSRHSGRSSPPFSRRRRITTTS